MSEHIDAVRRAIEFGSPDKVPMDLVDVPHLYDAYGTLDEDSDGTARRRELRLGLVSPTTGRSSTPARRAGEPIRRDEWGCTQSRPAGIDPSPTRSSSARPWTRWRRCAPTPGPMPSVTDRLLRAPQRMIAERYPDRFIYGLLDPARSWSLSSSSVTRACSSGYTTASRSSWRCWSGSWTYQLALVPRFNAMGAHMVNVIDEVAGERGMMFSPGHLPPALRAPVRRGFSPRSTARGCTPRCCWTAIWRTSCLNLMRLDIDEQLFVQPHATGLDVSPTAFVASAASSWRST